MAHCPIGANARKCYSPPHGGVHCVIGGLGVLPPLSRSRGGRVVRSVSLRVVRVSQARAGAGRVDSIGSRGAQLREAYIDGYEGSGVVTARSANAERSGAERKAEVATLRICIRRLAQHKKFEPLQLMNRSLPR